jgi:hypothetical protein
MVSTTNRHDRPAAPTVLGAARIPKAVLSFPLGSPVRHFEPSVNDPSLIEAFLRRGQRIVGPWGRVATLIVYFSGNLAAAAEAQTVVGNTITCPTCRVDLQVLTKLGTADGPGALPAMPSAIQQDRRGYYFVLSFGDIMPMVFQPNGYYHRTIGREGGGPSEFLSPYEVLTLPGDSILIFDHASLLAKVIGPDFSVNRSIRLPGRLSFSGVVLEWPRSLLLNALAQSPANFGWPLHVMDMSQTDAVIRHSFGRNGGELRPDDPEKLIQRLAMSRSGNVWAVEELRYQISEWSPSGQLVRSIERAPSWFPAVSTGLRGGPKRPPQPRITGIAEDENGLLWVFAWIAAENWQAAWQRRTAPGAGDASVSRLPPMDSLYQTMIEIIDPERRQVLAAARTPHLIFGTLPGVRIKAAAYAMTGEGVPLVTVLSFRVRR